MNLFNKFRFGNGDQSARLGIDIAGSRIAQAGVRHHPGQKPRLVDCGFEACDEPDDLSSALARLKTQRFPVNSIISSASYQLLLVEAPDVPEVELRAAVRWRIKDLIDFHIDDAVIDVFEIPEQSRGGQTRMMHAVAARNDVIQQHVNLLTNRGYELSSIDIPELCLRNLAAQLPEDTEGVALLHLTGDRGALSITKNQLIYLTRNIDTGLLHSEEEQGRTDFIESLLLEIRRSLDYFESHYDQKPISAFYVTGLDDEQRNDINLELPMPVKALKVSDCVDVDFELDPEIERQCLPAVGAALRVEAVSL